MSFSSQRWTLKNHTCAWSLVSTCEGVEEGHSRQSGESGEISLWKEEPGTDSILGGGIEPEWRD